MMDLLLQAKEMADSDPDQALRICNDVLNKSFDEPEGQMALFMAGYIMMQAERFGLAYQLYQRCAQLQPNKSEIYSNMGMCLEVERPLKALECFKKAIELQPDNPKAYANAGLIYLQTNRPEKCIEYCDKAMELDPELKSAKHNKGLALVMLRRFREGWDLYSDTLGVKYREIQDYGYPEWDGKSQGTILIYGEQGVGDEIMFASMYNDLIKDGYRIVLDTDARLHSLFSNTFEFPVYGTRFSDEFRTDQKIDYQCAAGQLCAWYRSKESDFPGDPFLKPNKERQIMWRALFDTFKGKKVGLAWSGGLYNTGSAKRSYSLDDYAPLMSDENTYISLQYKDFGDDRVKQYPDTTGKGQKIDDLAAMISQLDYVITCCTTVVYIAGALGIPCYVMVPSEPSYRYHKKGQFPWFKSVYLHRQRHGEKWSNCAKRLQKVVNNDSCIHRLRSA